MTSEIISYEYEFIEKLSSIFHAELDDNTLNKLLEIKKNNKFIRRQSPIRLIYKTTMVDKWRNSRVSNSVCSDTSDFCKILISNLNKISDQNYSAISTKIIEIFSSIESVEDLNLFIKTICNKAMTEIIYSRLYANLINDVIMKSNEKNNTYTSIPEIVLDICNVFFKEFSDVKLQELNDVKDYDTICEITKMKSKLTGGYIFIANLYKNNIVCFKIVDEYYKLLVDHTRAAPEEHLGKYIDAISDILTNCGAKLQSDNPKEFKEKYMDICYDIISDKKTLLPKYKFKLMDICDKYNNNWEDSNDDW